MRATAKVRNILSRKKQKKVDMGKIVAKKYLNKNENSWSKNLFKIKMKIVGVFKKVFEMKMKIALKKTI